MWTFVATHSHLYPGHIGRFEPPEDDDIDRAMIEFSDGSMAFGRIALSDGPVRKLDVEPYQTVAGTSIGAKHWKVRLKGEEFRVLSALAKESN